MRIPGLPSQETTRQPDEAETNGNVLASYDTYRDICDTEDAFHKVGILDAEGYAAATNDGRTVFADVNGVYVPAVISLEHEGGYASARTARLTESAQPMLAALPFSHMLRTANSENSFTGGEELTDDFTIVVEQPGLEDQSDSARAKIAAYFAPLGQLVRRDFIDPRVKDLGGHGKASLSLYSCSFGPSGYGLERPPAENVDSAWKEYAAEKGMNEVPDPHATGTYLLSSAQLRERPEIADALWRISEVGFGEVLGRYHPVSMEETKQFFERHLFSKDAYTAIHFQDGDPICFGSLLFDIEDCDWLNTQSTAIEAELKAATENNERPLWFTEITSKGIAQSPRILQLFLELGGRTQQKYRLLFESSNFASEGIVPLAQRQIDRADKVVLTRPVEQCDRMSYWYLKPEEAGYSVS